MIRLLISGGCIILLCSSAALGISPEVDINKEITNTMSVPAYDVTVELWGHWTISSYCLGTSDPDLNFADVSDPPTYSFFDGGEITKIKWSIFVDNEEGDNTIDPGQTIHIGWRGVLEPNSLPSSYIPFLENPFDPYAHLPGVKTCYWTDINGDPMEDAYIPNSIAWKGEGDGSYKIFLTNTYEDGSKGLPLTFSDMAEAVYSTRMSLLDLNAGNVSLNSDLDASPDQLGGAPLTINYLDYEILDNTFSDALVGEEFVVLRYSVTSPGTAADVVDYVQFQVPPLRPTVFPDPEFTPTFQGEFTDVGLYIEGSRLRMGGFDFLIAYDAVPLAFIEATPGQLLEDCGWEHFTYRYGVNGNCGDACPSGLLRIVALAETNNGPYHPNCYGPPDTDRHELAVLKFYVTNDRTFECQFVPISFFWDDCNDNAISGINGEELYVDRTIFDADENIVWDEPDDDQFPETERIPFVGAPDYCLEGDKEAPFRLINFVNGGIDIICADSIDVRCDINLNGIPYEISDAVAFVNCLTIPGSCSAAAIAASDCNGDGMPMSIADLVYLIRVIIGDAVPYPKDMPQTAEAEVSTLINHSAVAVAAQSNVDIGGGYFEFKYTGYDIGEPHLINGASDMTLEYGMEDGTLRVVVYSMEKGRKIPAGDEHVFAIPISDEGTITLTDVQLSDYNGNIVPARIVSEPVLPEKYTLHQSYPNPFNASATIMYELPIATHIMLDIFNTLGQRVMTLVDRDETAGIHSVTWDGTNSLGETVASGVYIYRITTAGFTAERKMVLMK